MIGFRRGGLIILRSLSAFFSMNLLSISRVNIIKFLVNNAAKGLVRVAVTIVMFVSLLVMVYSNHIIL